MDRPKILGQISPIAAQDTLLYQCPETAIGAVSSSIMVCNTSLLSGTFSIYAVRASSSPANSNLILTAAPLIPEDTYIATIGITLGSLESLYCLCDIADVVFTVLGAERT